MVQASAPRGPSVRVRSSQMKSSKRLAYQVNNVCTSAVHATLFMTSPRLRLHRIPNTKQQTNKLDQSSSSSSSSSSPPPPPLPLLPFMTIGHFPPLCVCDSFAPSFSFFLFFFLLFFIRPSASSFSSSSSDFFGLSLAEHLLSISACPLLQSVLVQFIVIQSSISCFVPLGPCDSRSSAIKREDGCKHRGQNYLDTTSD